MKLPEQLSKTLAGVGLILLGSGVSLIPVIGQIAGPAIITAGGSVVVYGLNDKRKRSKASDVDVWEKEKNLVNKITRKEK